MKKTKRNANFFVLKVVFILWCNLLHSQQIRIIQNGVFLSNTPVALNACSEDLNIMLTTKYLGSHYIEPLQQGYSYKTSFELWDSWSNTMVANFAYTQANIWSNPVSVLFSNNTNQNTNLYAGLTAVVYLAKKPGNYYGVMKFSKQPYGGSYTATYPDEVTVYQQVTLNGYGYVVPSCGASNWLSNFGTNQGWATADKYLRVVKELDFSDVVPPSPGADIIGFGDAGVYVSKSTGTSFTQPSLVLSSFGYLPSAGAWTSNYIYPRFVIDVNHDNRADIVGFDGDGVKISAGNGDGTFGNPWYGYYGNFGAGSVGGGWSNMDAYPRTLADVNGDGHLDIVGFGYGGVQVALWNLSGWWSQSTTWSSQWGTNTGWNSNNIYPRFVVDMNGDNKADIVGFSQTGVSVAYSNGGTIMNGQSIGSFQTATQWTSDFGVSSGWANQAIYPRQVVDLNNDGRPDVLGFGTNGVGSVLNRTLQGLNSFAYPSQGANNDFGLADGFVNNTVSPRYIGKIDNDPYPDILAITTVGYKVAIGAGNGNFYCAQDFPVNQYSPAWGWTGDDVFPRGLYNVSASDGTMEIVGFANNQVVVTNCSTFYKDSENLWGEPVSDDLQSEEAVTPIESVFKIYPNPSKGEFQVSSVTDNGYSVEIFNLLGELIYVNSFFAGGVNTISLLDKPKGIYLIKLKDTSLGHLHSQKIIIE